MEFGGKGGGMKFGKRISCGREGWRLEAEGQMTDVF